MRPADVWRRRLVWEVREKIRRDTVSVGMPEDDRGLDAGGTGATAYADALATYLGIAVARYSNSASTICSWNPGIKKEDIRFTLSRQALQMTGDYAEGNPFSKSSGNFADNFETWLYKALLFLPRGPVRGVTMQADAATQAISGGRVVSTDPPYYDNIGYADLSDYFVRVHGARVISRLRAEDHPTQARVRWNRAPKGPQHISPGQRPGRPGIGPQPEPCKGGTRGTPVRLVSPVQGSACRGRRVSGLVGCGPFRATRGGGQ
jgi:adenine-specific DNA methylase